MLHTIVTFFNFNLTGRIKKSITVDHYCNTATTHKTHKTDSGISYQVPSLTSSSEPSFGEVSASQKTCLPGAQRNNPHHAPIWCVLLCCSCYRWEFGRRWAEFASVMFCFHGCCTCTLKQLKVHGPVRAGFIVPFLLIFNTPVTQFEFYLVSRHW